MEIRIVNAKSLTHLSLLIALLSLLPLTVINSQESRPARKGINDEKSREMANKAVFGHKDCIIRSTYSAKHTVQALLVHKNNNPGEDVAQRFIHLLENDGGRWITRIDSSGIRQMDSTMYVYDTKAARLVTLAEVDGAKTATCMEMNSNFYKGQSSREVLDNFILDTRVDRIRDWDCKHWTTSAIDGTKVEIWVSDDLDLPLNEMLTDMISMRLLPFPPFHFSESGTVLRLAATHPDGTHILWEATSIFIDRPAVIHTAGYRRI